MCHNNRVFATIGRFSLWIAPGICHTNRVFATVDRVFATIDQKPFAGSRASRSFQRTCRALKTGEKRFEKRERCLWITFRAASPIFLSFSGEKEQKARARKKSKGKKREKTTARQQHLVRQQPGRCAAKQIGSRPGRLHKRSFAQRWLFLPIPPKM